MPATNSLRCCKSYDEDHGSPIGSKKKLVPSPRICTSDCTEPLVPCSPAVVTPSVSSSRISPPPRSSWLPLRRSFPFPCLRDALGEAIPEAELLRISCHPVCYSLCRFANDLLSENTLTAFSSGIEHGTRPRNSEATPPLVRAPPLDALPRRFCTLVRQVVDEHRASCGGDLLTACEWVTMDTLNNEVDSWMEKLDVRRRGLCQRLEVALQRPARSEHGADTASSDCEGLGFADGAEETCARSEIAAVCGELTEIFATAMELTEGIDALSICAQQNGEGLLEALQEWYGSNVA